MAGMDLKKVQLCGGENVATGFGGVLMKNSAQIFKKKPLLAWLAAVIAGERAIIFYGEEITTVLDPGGKNV